MASHKASSLDPGVKELRNLLQRVQKPDTPSDVKESIEKVLELFDKREDYSRAMSIPDSQYTQKIAEMTGTTNWKQLYDDRKVGELFSPNWMSGSGQGQLLQYIIRMQKATRVLELGMFTGYISMAMAEVLPENGKVVTCEYEPHLVEMCRKTFDETPFGKKIDIRQGPGMSSMDKLASEGHQFDVVYLDADKDGYLGYFKKLLDLDMLAPGGTLVVDNAFEFGNAYTKTNTVVDTFNKAVAADDRVDQIMFPMIDGISLIRRKGE